MSKYTTEVRFICETEYGLSESKGYKDIDEIVDKVWDKVFYSKFPIFDEEYRKPLCKKILKHFYTREIGAETVGLWKFWINRDLEEQMPYFNQLYESALLKFDPFKDVDYETTGNKKGNGSSSEETKNSGKDAIKNSGKDTVEFSGKDKNVGNETNRGSDSLHSSEVKSGEDTVDNSGNYTNSRDEWSKFSDTPQGRVNQIDLTNNAFLTNATHNTGTSVDNVHADKNTTKYGSNITTDSTTSYGKETDTSNELTYGKIIDTKFGKITETEYGKNTTVGSVNNSTEEYVNKIAGKMHGLTYSEMLMKFRETFLNIDMQVIASLEDNFLGLW